MRRTFLLAMCAVVLGLVLLGRSSRGLAQAPSPLSGQTQEEADRKSAGCIGCHKENDAKTMHASPSVKLGCTDCHGGNATSPAPSARGTPCRRTPAAAPGR